MDRGDIVKKAQNLVDCHIVLVEKKRCKYTKFLNDAVISLENLEKQTQEQHRILKDVTSAKDALLKCINEQTEIEEDQTAELVRLKQQLKTLSKKFSLLNNQDLNINQADRERAFRKRLRLSMIKVSTKVFIDENSPPNIIRGFAGDDVQKMLFPFEFDTDKNPKEKCKEELWEISKKTSRYPVEWEKLFSV